MFKHKGLSLIELLTVLAILGVALSFAAPSFRELLINQQLQSATYELQGALNTAREIAVMQHVPVSVVPNEEDWSRGWRLFTDRNNNGVQDPGEELLATQAGMQSVQVYADTTSRRYIHYTPRGNSIQPNGAFHAGSFVLCTKGSLASRIIINNAGRIRRESGNASQLCRK